MLGNKPKTAPYLLIFGVLAGQPTARHAPVTASPSRDELLSEAALRPANVQKNHRKPGDQEELLVKKNTS